MLEDSILLYNQEKKRLEYDFFKRNPQSYATAFVLLLYYGYYTVAELKKLYEAMGNKLQTSLYGKELLEHIRKMETTTTGILAADFSGKDLITGKNFRLHDARGKYVLIDFWGSWCQPCIALIPSIVKEYHKYSNKNIVFASIAYDNESDIAKTKALIKTHGMTWVNLWQDRKDEENSIIKKYNIHAFPTTILLNPQGEIIHRGEGMEEFIRISRLLEKLF